jgi:phosphatidylglycerophosphate synthase
MLERFKPLYNAVLRPVTRVLAHAGVHPNVLTVGGVIMFGIGGWLTMRGNWRLALFVGAFGAIMDGMDGVLARETGQKSVFGGVLDSVCDRFTEIIWLGSLLFYYANSSPANVMHVYLTFYLTFGVLTGSIMVSYVKARAESAGISCNTGVLQRPERLIILAIFQFAGPAVMPYGLGIVALLAWVTVAQRIIVVWKNCQKSDGEPNGYAA